MARCISTAATRSMRCPPRPPPNPVVGDAAYTLSGSDDSLHLWWARTLSRASNDVTCTAGSGYFAFDLPMENTRTMYCSAWLYGDDTMSGYAPPHHPAEGTELTLSNYNDMDFTGSETYTLTKDDL